MFGRFALAWDEFQPKMAGRFKSLLQSGDFSDVTLVSKDNTRVKAHKVILGSGSKFFKEILSHMDNHPNPLIYMMGVDLEVMEMIINFLYMGKVEVKQEMIEVFMKTATELQIDGLHSKEVEMSGEIKRPLIETESETQFNVRFGAGGMKANDNVSEMFNVKKKKKKKPTQEVLSEVKTNKLVLDANNYEVKAKIPGVVDMDKVNYSLSDFQYPCDLCEFVTDRRKDLRYHMGEKHRHEQDNLKIENSFAKKREDGLYWCSLCEKKFGDPSNSRRHVKKVHYKILHFCTDCNYSSINKAYVKDHHNSEHLGMKFPCSLCSYQAKTPSTLRIHEKSTHE